MTLQRLCLLGLLAANMLGDSPAWVEISNRNARELLAVDAKFSSESAGEPNRRRGPMFEALVLAMESTSAATGA